jgi:hypothetical protein
MTQIDPAEQKMIAALPDETGRSVDACLGDSSAWRRAAYELAG